MKYFTSITHSHKAVLGLAFATMVLLSGCVSKSQFLTSEIIPAARGDVQVKLDDNKNYNIQVSIEYLAEASRLNPPKQTYVIWMESEHNSTRNLGQINTTSSSNKLKADFETSSSYPPTRIFITAEEDGTVAYPGSMVVLTTGRIKG